MIFTTFLYLVPLGVVVPYSYTIFDSGSTTRCNSLPRMIIDQHHIYIPGSPVAKCKLCDFAATSKDALGKHMLVHAAENNKDLVHLYGFSSESFTENGNPESAVPKSASGSEKRNAESSSSVPISTAHQLEVEKRRFALMQKV